MVRQRGILRPVSHPDVAEEQRYIDEAYQHAQRMRDRAEQLAADDSLASEEFDAAVLRTIFQERARALAGALDGPLCFGRIDAPEERHYIGRTHVEDTAGRPLVIDWRARAAVPFYRATFADPMDLTNRRRFLLEGRTLVDILEENFLDPEQATIGAGGVPDPLLAELGRARTGRMRDIVATIQAEQDEVIRAPLEDCLIVQGGPGTGKTAVGLHRATFLLFEHRERLGRDGVLVIGPNPLFLDYISQVLPSLGERSVAHATIESLLGRFRVEEVDSSEAIAVKADARMATVVQNGAREAIALPSDDLKIPYRRRFIRIEAKRIIELIQLAADARQPWANRRNHFRMQLVRLAREQLPRELRVEADADDFRAAVLSGPARGYIDRCWRTLSAVALVRRLLTSQKALARASLDVLSAAEQAAILRKPRRRREPDPWTRADLPLLDEAEAFLNGMASRVEHIVVDEAQDRTPMELRLIGRRSASGSMTILGDLAQATAIGAPRSWDAVEEHLRTPAPVRLVELTIGYRVPAAILGFANRLLPVAASDVKPAHAVREEGEPPSVIRCRTQKDLLEEVTGLADGWRARYSSTAVISPRSLADKIGILLQRLNVSYATETSSSLGKDLAVLTPAGAKGLEFDAVVVVEPAAIVAEEPGAERALFVSLTRPVQHLTVLHVRDLPLLLQ
jgi:DNA helicase IV